MGYYSFYRIIKDILYNIKKNKILVVIAIIILVLFLCNNVFASASDFILPNEFNNYKNYVIIKYDNKYFAYSSDSDFIISTKTSGLIWLGFNKAFTNYIGCENNNSLNFSNSSVINSRSGSFENDRGLSSIIGFSLSRSPEILFSNHNIYDTNGNLYFENNDIKYPQVTTSLEDLQTLNFDTISVSAWDWSNKDLYILFYDRTLMNNQNTEGLYPKKEIKLTKETSYFIPEISSEENAIYWIANDNTGLNFKVGGQYEIRLAERVPQSTGRRLSWRFLI